MSDSDFDRDRLRLADRFEELSRLYPKLRLIALSAPASLGELQPNAYTQDYDEGVPGDIRPFIRGPFKPQVLKTKTGWCSDFEADDEAGTFYADDPRPATENDYKNPDQVIWSLSLPKFAFPQWVFQPGDPVWKSGVWSIWLYRNFGRDPESDNQEIPNPPEQVACVDAYGIVCQEATRFVRRYVKNLGLPEWYLKWFSDCASNASGSGFDNPFGVLGVCWLLGMLPNRGQVFTGYEAVTDDLGVYSSRMLRALPVNRTNENHADDDQVDRDGVPMADHAAADGLSPDGRTLRWGGELYPLGPSAAGVVKLLVDAYLSGFPYLHEEYLKENGDTETDMRRLVPDNGLSAVCVRQQSRDGKQVKGMWGLIDPKKLLSAQKVHG